MTGWRTQCQPRTAWRGRSPRVALDQGSTVWRSLGL